MDSHLYRKLTYAQWNTQVKQSFTASVQMCVHGQNTMGEFDWNCMMVMLSLWFWQLLIKEN